MAEQKNEVTKASGAQLPEGYDFEQMKADAAQNPTMDANDVSLPFLAVLQGLSPQVNPGHGEHIEGAQASMFHNTVSNEVFEGRKEGLLIVPCYYERRLVEWVDRDSGGGWVADYPVGHPVANTAKKKEGDKKNTLWLPNGNVLVETAYHYVLWMHPDTSRWSQACVGLKSTGLRKNRQFNNSIAESVIPGTDIQAPRYLFPYVMRTEFESKGENSWWNYMFTKVDEPIAPDLYKKAKEFALLSSSGAITRGSETGTTTPEGQYDPETGEVNEIPI